MRSALLALRAASAVTALVAAPILGTATAAHAQDSVRVTVKPSTIAPGGEVEVQVEGCKAITAVATSPAFAADTDLARRAFGQEYNEDQAALARNPDFATPLRGHVKIKASTGQGRQSVDVRCDGRHHSAAGSFSVTAGAGPGRPEALAPPERPGHHPTPHAPVKAGGGGTSTALAADAPEDAGTAGPGTRHAVIGLVLAGVAAVAVAFRSVRRQRTAGRDAD